MSKTIILVIVAALAGLVILSSATFGDPGPAPVVGAALPSLKDLPLAHAFSGTFANVSVVKPLSITMPPDTGFVLTFLKEQYAVYSVRILINNVEVRSGKGYELGLGGWMASGAPDGDNGKYNVPPSNPPIIIPPGATLTIHPESPTQVHRYNLGGYFISRGDLGLP